MANQGFFGSLAGSMQSPLFLGGAGILMGGGYQGMNAGIQAGVLGQKQQHDAMMQEADRQRQAQQDAENGRRFNLQDARAATMHPLELDARRAQTDRDRAHADAYRATASSKYSAIPTDQRFQNLGMKLDGTVVDLSDESANATAGSRVLGAGTESGGSERAAMAGYIGRQNSSVPGVVLDAKGRSDRFATTVAQGQDAMADSPAEQRQRMAEWQSTQHKWTYLHGRGAPSGFAYNADGSLRDLKEESKKAVSREKIRTLIDDVQAANQVLQKTNVAQRGLAHATGGWISPESEQAARTVEHAVQFMTAEVEGKRHANAQDVRMLRFFAPKWNDPEDMIGFKTDQLNRIMQGYFGATVPSGEVFRSKMTEATEAYKAAVASGKIPATFSTKSSPLETGGEMPRDIPTISSPAQARGLPKGTVFRTPDGRTLRND
jgi:hypothetical protein